MPSESCASAWHAAIEQFFSTSGAIAALNETAGWARSTAAGAVRHCRGLALSLLEEEHAAATSRATAMLEHERRDAMDASLPKNPREQHTRDEGDGDRDEDRQER